MSQLNELKRVFSEARAAFYSGVDEVRSNWEKEQQQKHGAIKIEALSGEDADFSLYYCLSETLNQLERKIAENPSRELALVKTKLQEALFWAERAK